MMNKILKISVWGTTIVSFAQTLAYFYFYYGDDRYGLSYPLYATQTLISVFFFYSFLRKERGLIGLISDVIMIVISILLIITYYPFAKQDIIYQFLFGVFILLIRLNERTLFDKDRFTGQL